MKILLKLVLILHRNSYINKFAVISPFTILILRLCNDKIRRDKLSLIDKCHYCNPFIIRHMLFVFKVGINFEHCTQKKSQCSDGNKDYYHIQIFYMCVYICAYVCRISIIMLEQLCWWKHTFILSFFVKPFNFALKLQSCHK